MYTKTTIGDYSFTNCLMNASGIHSGTGKELDELIQSPAGSLVTKTATLEPRVGNESPRFAWDNIGSINFMGLPN